MSDKTELNRLPDRSVDDRSDINAILDDGFLCHVGYVIDGRPVVLPTLYARDGDRILIHGSNSMGLAKAVRRGSPLCVTVTHLDGLVAARSAFHSSANYRSVVVHGIGDIVDDNDKEAAFDLIVEHIMPGRLADIRPSTRAEIGQTAVISLSLDETSAKARSGGPNDDPEDLDASIWAGVIPFTLKAGEPQPAPELDPAIPTPEYFRDFSR